MQMSSFWHWFPWMIATQTIRKYVIFTPVITPVIITPGLPLQLFVFVPLQEQAFELSQKYKEGKYIIELSHMIKDNGWDWSLKRLPSSSVQLKALPETAWLFFCSFFYTCYLHYYRAPFFHFDILMHQFCFQGWSEESLGNGDLWMWEIVIVLQPLNLQNLVGNLHALLSSPLSAIHKAGTSIEVQWLLVSFFTLQI